MHQSQRGQHVWALGHATRVHARPFLASRLFSTRTSLLYKAEGGNPVSTSPSPPPQPQPQQQQQQQRHQEEKQGGDKARLTHLTPSGTAHMVPIATKPPTARLAKAVCAVRFSDPSVAPLVRA